MERANLLPLLVGEVSVFDDALVVLILAVEAAAVLLVRHFVAVADRLDGRCVHGGRVGAVVVQWLADDLPFGDAVALLFAAHFTLLFSVAFSVPRTIRLLESFP